ncbi:hypothetical protein KIN20_003669 [Parelaphostrongylus tenuis]|uniref:DEAD/DEAH box helicase domain-containing protein n=1 Tax=Parelaphostrongylus tenuis TaxID=148309 RepID=A0AAD5M1W0_PARTN|nr:hypothetical protein KIN20_003669 [Parelaphostrongylus tenuis]
MIDQANELVARPHIVVATPGRLADHIESNPDGQGQLFRFTFVKNFCERHENSSVIVFAQTCRECQALVYMFDAHLAASRYRENLS